MKFKTLKELADAIAVRNYLRLMSDGPDLLNKEEARELVSLSKNFDKQIMKSILDVLRENLNTDDFEKLKGAVPVQIDQNKVEKLKEIAKNAEKFIEENNPLNKRNAYPASSEEYQELKERKKPGPKPSFKRANLEGKSEKMMVGPSLSKEEKQNENSEKSE